MVAIAWSVTACPLWCSPPSIARIESSVVRDEKILELLEDMKAQGARVIGLPTPATRRSKLSRAIALRVQANDRDLSPLLEVVPRQLFAY